MFVFVSIVIIVACILLTLIVLIQNPKGGGIAANFVSPNQIMGVKRSTDVVEKATWILAATLIVLALGSNFFRPYGEATTNTVDSRIKENIENTVVPAAPQQQAPAVAPAQQDAQPDPNSAPAQ
ncbi:MAG: preprotein translocase subunit SecG [Bacteroidota bacterium]|jgi:preprotein translocase subunit SecG|nr:preprotein translocase subunit SecG [Sphingobacteriales bacterium]